MYITIVRDHNNIIIIFERFVCIRPPLNIRVTLAHNIISLKNVVCCSREKNHHHRRPSLYAYYIHCSPKSRQPGRQTTSAAAAQYRRRI